MANSATHAALPYPIINAKYSLALTFRTSAGTPTDPTTPDTEYSLNGGQTYFDCANEIDTGGLNGAGFITLTGAETNVSLLVLAAKSANCLTTPVILFPRTLATVGTGTLAAGSVSGGTLGTLLAYDVTGCFFKTTGGAGGGNTGGADNQARKMVTYNTTTGVFTVSPNFETALDNTTTYVILLPEGVTLGMLRTLNPATAGQTLNVDTSGRVLLNATQSATTFASMTLTGNLLLNGGTLTHSAGMVYSFTSGTAATTSNIAVPTATANAMATWNYLASNATVSGSMGSTVVAGSGSTGFTGTYATTFAFVGTDGTTAIPNVIFSIAGVGSANSNGSGLFTGGINVGAWTLTAAPTAGVLFSPTTFTVAAAGTVTITGTAIPLPTPGAAQCTGVLTFKDKHGAASAGETLTIEADPDFAYTATGSGFSGLPILSDASNVNGGIAVLLPSGALPMRARNRHGRWIKFTTAANNGETFGLPSVLGQV